MSRLPGIVFVVDIKKEAIAVKEAKRLGIPVVAIVDTNTDPDPIDYPIPANDDALKSVQLIAKAIADAVLDGVERASAKQQAEAEERATADAAEKASEKK
jgi:small subunit ribosomal protein S2